SGRTVQIRKAAPVFKLWRGRRLRDTYGGKSVLNFYHKPEFAELGILRIFEREGWEGVWVDTFPSKFRTRYWPRNEVALPKNKQALLDMIHQTAGCRDGCFDVFCWKGRRYVFVESKRFAKDRIRDTQKLWIQAALQCGVPTASLLIVEWNTI